MTTVSAERIERRKLNTQTVNSGALATLAALVALAAVAIQSRTLDFWYGFWAISSAICLVASVVVGGRAIDRLQEEHMLFEWQTRLCLLGFILGVISVVAMGPSHDEQTRSQLQELAARVGRIEARLDTIGTNRRAIDTSLASLNTKLDRLARRIGARR